ncbi:DUF6625 family protein [Bacillus mobilis]|uniref:DUF6625 family protein n=2 Tax=Bacillus mobilis TaxID=2026190 RepID=UPI0039EEAFD0
MKKIAIICVYFGDLPGWINLWLKSCEKNEQFDWILITDDEKPYNYPKNVKRYTYSFHAIQNLFNYKLKMKISMNDPYKLCDFKPTFGVVFEKYLRGYTHWGHCDLDIIFGDISSFISDAELDDYDKLLTWGHLSIYKNNEKVNNYYKLNIPGLSYKEVFTNPIHFGFDERNGIEKILKHHNVKILHKECVADILPQQHRFKIFNDFNYNEQVFYWDNGKLYQVYYLDGERKLKEYAYIHFQKRKIFLQSNPKQFEEKIIISPDGFFFDSIENLEQEDFRGYNRGNLAKTVKMYYRYKKYAIRSAIERRRGYKEYYKKN